MKNNVFLKCAESDQEHSIVELKKELLALRHMLEDLTDKTTPHAVESHHPLLLEMVLILRQLAKPEHVRIAQGELKRLGVLSI